MKIECPGLRLSEQYLNQLWSRKMERPDGRFYNPPDSFQIFQFMSREGISTAICYQEVKKVSSHPTKSL